jgi:hypothetical protein
LVAVGPKFFSFRLPYIHGIDCLLCCTSKLIPVILVFALLLVRLSEGVVMLDEQLVGGFFRLSQLLLRIT